MSYSLQNLVTCSNQGLLNDLQPKNDVFTIDSIFVNLWFDSTLEAPWFVFNQVTAISLSKCPILQTIVLSSFAQSENLERYLYFQL
jgi:hypothetical protein